MACRGDMRKSISLKPESQQCTHCKYANCGGKKVNADIQNAFENSKLTAFHWKVYFMQFIHDNKKKISNDFIYSVCTCTSVMKYIQSGRNIKYHPTTGYYFKYGQYLDYN